MEDPVIVIGCDVAASKAAFAGVVLRGVSMQMMVIDDIGPLVSEELYKLLEEGRSKPSGDFAELEKRILACFNEFDQKAPFDYGWPDKVAAEAPEVKHAVHPKAKAKLPFYHQRRRF